MAISHLKDTPEMARRSPPRKRTWIVDCKVCHRWTPVESLEIQAICKEAGACIECMNTDYFILRVRIAALETNMEAIVARGKRMPEDRRVFLRKVYAKMSRKLAAARVQLAELEAARCRLAPEVGR